MRKMVRVVAIAALVLGGVVVAGPPAYASHSCADAVDMVPSSTQMGAVTVQGTVGTFEQSDWWRHDGTPSPRTVTLTGDADLFVHDACGNITPICQSTQTGTDTCTATPSGDIFIEVRLQLPATAANYTLSVMPPPPTDCSDGVDNDGDGAVDYPADPHCTSLSDPTEAAVTVAVAGGVQWGTATTENPQVVTLWLTGTFADPAEYTCGVHTAPLRVVCDALPNPNVQWVCSTFPLAATAPSAFGSTSQVGNVRGTLKCDNPGVVQTDDVVLTGTKATSNTQQGINLGTANRVTCGSAGIFGGPNADGAFSVHCGPFDPGVEWPYGEPPAPGRYGDTVIQVVRI